MDDFMHWAARSVLQNTRERYAATAEDFIYLDDLEERIDLAERRPLADDAGVAA